MRVTYIVAGAFGALTSVAIMIASLKYYVGISNPYLVWAASFCVLEIVLILVRNRRGKQTSLSSNALAFSLDAVLFGAGAAAALYGLLAIYPPNFG